MNIKFYVTMMFLTIVKFNQNSDSVTMMQNFPKCPSFLTFFIYFFLSKSLSKDTHI